MKRPKSLPSRRQRALRRGVVLAVFLLAFLAIHRPSITPGQVIRASENLLGLERTEVLAQAEVLSHRVTFSANQDALLLTVYQPLHPLSYSGGTMPSPLGCSAPPRKRPQSPSPCSPFGTVMPRKPLSWPLARPSWRGPARCGSTTTQAFGIIAPTYSWRGPSFPPPRETGTSSCTSPPPPRMCFSPPGTRCWTGRIGFCTPARCLKLGPTLPLTSIPKKAESP